MERKRAYNIINVVTLFVSAGVFLYLYSNVYMAFKFSSNVTIIILLFTIILVHGIKAFRLFFALYGRGLPFGEYIKQYCKVTLVSMLLPFKSGDFFRVYCYGYQMRDYFGSTVVILFDRFVDTLALVTAIVLMKMISMSEFIPIFYLLLVFLVCLIIFYFIFPGMYYYWKRYFLVNKASRRRNRFLKILEQLNHAYTELAIVVKGRGMVLYVLSLMAWAVEIGGIAISDQLLLGEGTMQVVSEYLTAVLIGADSIYLKQFVSISIVLLIAIYVVLYVIELIRKRVKSNEECMDSVR